MFAFACFALFYCHFGKSFGVIFFYFFSYPVLFFVSLPTPRYKLSFMDSFYTAICYFIISACRRPLKINSRVLKKNLLKETRLCWCHDSLLLMMMMIMSLNRNGNHKIGPTWFFFVPFEEYETPEASFSEHSLVTKISTYSITRIDFYRS